MTAAEKAAATMAGNIRNAWAVLGADHQAGAMAGAAVAFGWLAALRLWGIK